MVSVKKRGGCRRKEQQERRGLFFWTIRGSKALEMRGILAGQGYLPAERIDHLEGDILLCTWNGSMNVDVLRSAGVGVDQ